MAKHIKQLARELVSFIPFNPPRRKEREIGRAIAEMWKIYYVFVLGGCFLLHWMGQIRIKLLFMYFVGFTCTYMEG